MSEDQIQVNVQGHSLPLFYKVGTSRCGNVNDGISFEFGNEGVWVISLAELKGIVEAEESRRKEEQ